MNVPFSHLMPDSLRPTGEPVLTGGSLKVPLNGGGQIVIVAFTSDHPLAQTEVECFLVKLHYVGQKQFIEIHQRGSRKRLGYLFPVSALAADSEFDRWEGAYAHAAAGYLLTTDAASDYLALNEAETLLGEASISIVDLFQSKLGVVVIGKERMADASCTIDTVRLMIQEFGIRPLSKGLPATSSIQPPEFSPRLLIRPCSRDVDDHLKQLTLLLSLAEQQEFPAAKFLITYQVVEAFISRVFDHSVRALMNDAAGHSDVWSLRDKLTEIANEKLRINKLVDEYIPGFGSEANSARADLRTACIEFLKKLDPTIIGKARNPPKEKAIVGSPVPAKQTAVPIDVTAACQTPAAIPATPPATTTAAGEVIATPPFMPAAETLDIAVTAGPVVEAAVPVVASSPAEAPIATPVIGAAAAAGPPTKSGGAPDDFEGKSWCDLLYTVRNIVVHRQWQVSAFPDPELNDVCVDLEQLCFVIINGFVANPSKTP